MYNPSYATNGNKCMVSRSLRALQTWKYRRFSIHRNVA